MEWKFADIKITNDPNFIDLKNLHNFLKTAYWCRNIPYNIMVKSISQSIPFSVLLDDKFIGFARLVTDSVTFAYLADVYIDQQYRGQGYGHYLVKAINNWIETHNIRTSLLLTRDAQSLYADLGWVHFDDITRIMRFKEPVNNFYDFHDFSI